MRKTTTIGGRTPLGPTLRVFVAAIGEPALREVLPLFAGIGIVAAVVFGPTGMSAADVTAAAAGSTGVRLGLWALWLTALAPASRGLFTNPAGFYLRALPVPRGHHYALVGGVLALFQLPWGWLWLRGAGLGPAAAAVTLAMAILAAQAIRARRTSERFAVVGSIAVALVGVGVGVGWPVLLAAGLFGTAAALAAAWRRAPEGLAPSFCAPIGGPAGLAMALAMVALLWRRRSAGFARGALVVALGAATTVLAARANQVTPTGLLTVSLAISAVTTAMVVVGFATGALEIERASRWILDTTGTGGATRVAAATLAVATIAGGFGALHGGAVAWGAGVSELAPRLIGGAMAQAIGLATIAVAMARYAERPSGVDGTLVAAGLIVLVVVTVIADGAILERSLVGLGGVAVLGAVGSVGRATRPEKRWRRAWRRIDRLE